MENQSNVATPSSPRRAVGGKETVGDADRGGSSGSGSSILPCAIITGMALYALFVFVPALKTAGDTMGPIIDIIFPFAVFLTLLTTFSKVNFRSMKLKQWHLWLLLAQILLTAACVAAILCLPYEQTDTVKVLLSALTCVIAPCASAAPVVVGKLGADISEMATYTLMSSVFCAFSIPAVFPIVEPAADISFIAASLNILQRLSTVILLPLCLGFVIRHYLHRTYRFIMHHPDLGFYFWAVSLTITSGITLKNIVHSQASGILLLVIALASMTVCLLHFAIGRVIGRHIMPASDRHNTMINCGQGMFQKNTALAIYVSYAYLSPTASIGAGFYVLWQNIVNSYEIWAKSRKNKGMKNAE